MSLPGKCFPAIAILIAFCSCWTTASATPAPYLNTVGLRVGDAFRGDDIQQYDVFFARNLPWTKSLDSGWQLESAAELTASALEGDQEDTVSGSVSADLFLVSPERMVSFHSGVGAGLLADDTMGETDFGGPVFFLFHAGASLRLHPRLALGYRYSHQSNGAIYEKNPSLNLHQIELRFSF